MALTQIAHLKLMVGGTSDSGQILEPALELFPDCHYALANLAKVRMAQSKYADAVRLMRRRYDAAPHPGNRFDMAEALKLTGCARRLWMPSAESKPGRWLNRPGPTTPIAN